MTKDGKAILGIIVIVVIVMASIVGFVYYQAGQSYTVDNSKMAIWDYSFAHKANFTYHERPVLPDSGYEFLVATIFVQNNQYKEISTNANYWEYRSNGVHYNTSPFTYFEEIADHQTLEIGKDGSATFQIVYQVPIGQNEGTITYSGPNSGALYWDSSLL